MRRGCMSVGDTVCDNCGRLVRHPEQYVAMDEVDLLPEDKIAEKLQKERPEGYEALKAGRQPIRYCLDCAMKKGYARYRTDRSEKVVTFFEK